MTDLIRQNEKKLEDQCTFQPKSNRNSKVIGISKIRNKSSSDLKLNIKKPLKDILITERPNM